MTLLTFGMRISIGVNQGNQLYKYDALSRVTNEKIPEQGDPTQPNQWTTSYTYTSFNAVATRTDARGVITAYSYDTLNRISQVSYNTISGVTTAPTVTYIYDTDPTYGTANDGAVVRINVGTDYQERYTFDQYKRTSSTIRRMGSQTYTTTDSYNQASQPLQNAFGAYQYDTAGRPSSITGPGNVGMSGMTYNIAGQVTGDTLTSSGWYNGYLINSSTAETFGYDTNRMQLISQTAVTTNTNGSFCVPPPCPPPPPGGTNLSLNYSYQASAGQMGVGTTAGNAGQLMAINNNSTIGSVAESASYTYDNYGRLVTSNQTSNGSSAQRRFAYDRWGNRSGVWDATSGGNQIQNVSLQAVSFPGTGSAPTNRITSVGNGKSGLTYSSYDANGNVTNDGLHSYSYDSENRLVNVDNGAAVYAYDHQNRRYKKTIGSSVTHYVWEGGQVVGEYNGSTGAVLAQYGYAGSRMIAKTAGGVTQYFLSDRLSMRLALSDVGVVVGRQATLPFGEDFAESGTQEKHHFTSYERGAETGSDYALNRQYAQNVGRFTSSDRYGPSLDFRAPQSLNRYSYVRNEPIDIRDPSGLNLEFFEGCTAIPIVVFNPETGAMAFAGLSAYSYCTIGSNNPTRGEPSLAPGEGHGNACTQDKRNFFNTNLNSYKKLAEKLQIDVRWIMGLSALESGWLGQHAQDLHNIWGVTKAGGDNLRFSSYREGADYWYNLVRGSVANAKTVDEFISGLTNAHYNTVNKKWPKLLRDVIDLVQIYADACHEDLTLPPSP